MYKKIITVCCCSESHPSECFIFQLDSSVKLIIELRERERERERKRERGGESLCSCARPRDCCVAGSCGPSLFPARVHPHPYPPSGGACPARLGVSARGQLCLGLRLRRSRCITERKIPPDGGLGLLLFSQGAVPLARPIFNIKIRTILTRKSIYYSGRW